jgi:hypothetical protein
MEGGGVLRAAWSELHGQSDVDFDNGCNEQLFFPLFQVCLRGYDSSW